MSKIREKMAATLINHVHVVEQSLSIGRRSRRPTSPWYKQIATLDFNDGPAVEKVMKSFSDFNAKNLIENIRFVIDKKIEALDGFMVDWAPKILLRGLQGRLVASQLDYVDATSILTALNFSRQTVEITSAIELAGSVVVVQDNKCAVDILIPAFKNSPFCNFEREQTDFNRIFAAKLLLIRTLELVARTMTPEQKNEIVNGRVNVAVEVDMSGDTPTPTAFTIEETDSARAQRIARERLEELRRRRTMLIESIEESDSRITYNLSPITAPDERDQIALQTQSLFGW
jgi:hypothetical protein